MRDKTAVVIDCDPRWLQFAGTALSTVPVEVVGKASSLREGTKLIAQREPDLVVVEISMYDNETTGVSWISKTAWQFPAVRVIAVSRSFDPYGIQHVLNAGAAAYIVRSDDPTDLAAAVRQLDQRSFFLRTERAKPVATVSTGDARLTKRELEIVRLAARGLPNGEIAKRLWVTEQTVKFHLANTYRKLGVSNRTAAARQAQLRGLLSAD